MIDIALDRLPHSPDAERAILGAILLDNHAIFQAEPRLTPGDFALNAHQRIYMRMVEMSKNGTPIDFVTLTEIIERQDGLANVGGSAYVMSLTDGLPRVKNIGQYVSIVKDKAILRQLIHITSLSLQQSVSDEEPASDVLGHIQEALIQLVNNEFPERSLFDMARSTLEELEELRRAEDPCIGLSCGLNEVDVLTTGYRDGEISVIGARPGNGKTAFAVQGLRRNLKHLRKVGFFSSEVPEKQILLRLACLETGLHVFDTRDPRVLSKEKYQKLQEAIVYFANEFKDSFFLDDTPCISIDRLLARARAWISKGVELIIIDYLQILDGTNSKWKTEQDRVSHSMVALWHLARATGIPVVVLSQLNRTAHNTRPDMASLRSSGTIENFAQCVMLLWREMEFDESGEQLIGSTGHDEIILAKQRSGPANLTVRTTFEKEVGFWKYRE